MTGQFPIYVISRLATTPGDINDIDDVECLEGYNDGRNNDPAPGQNSTNSYVQGWWAGMYDGGHRNYHPIDTDIVKAWLANEALCRDHTVSPK